MRRYDVVIVGGGMVGLCVANLLSRAGFDTALIESAEPQAFDASAEPGLRVSALSVGTVNILRQAGAWRHIERSRLCWYRRMHVEDDGAMAQTPGTWDASVDFTAEEFGMEALGVIVENDLTRWALWQTLDALGTVELLCPDQMSGFEAFDDRVELSLESGSTLQCSLLVGADGPASRVRRDAGLDQARWFYGQQGLVCVVGCRQPNPGVAWQRFTDGRPLAFLPLADGRSSIVWTLTDADAERLKGVDDEEFRSALGAAAGDWLGEVISVGPRACFSLGMRLGERYCAKRTALIGDAAHVVHPMAGQGVNIGFQDAAALVEVLADSRPKDPGADVLLERFNRWRRSEAEVMAFGVQGLKDLFAVPQARPLRKIGLALVSRSWLTREAFIRRAGGLHASAPALSRGVPLNRLASPAA